MKRIRRQEIAAGKRETKQREKERIEMERLKATLIETLPRYLSLHYGDPSTGRQGTILDGPIIARLAAAASLRALLMEEPKQVKPKAKKHR
jgi:hypothetical protein